MNFFPQNLIGGFFRHRLLEGMVILRICFVYPSYILRVLLGKVICEF